MNKYRQTPQAFMLIVLLLSVSCLSQLVWAEGGIRTDGTVGVSTTLGGSAIDIPESLGNRRGGNLFHSFSEFNVNNGQTVTFQENTLNSTDNVISRVTGSTRSDINGTLQITPGGKANFYLINPNGVTFGPNGSVNVPGSIHISTADQIKFTDGQVFSAVQPMSSSLTSAPPAAFGFLGTSTKNNGLFKMDSAFLNVNQGKSFDVVAGQIDINNSGDIFFSASNIVAEHGGEVRLIAVRGLTEISLKALENGFLSLPESTPTGLNAGHIQFKKAGIEIRGDGAGKLSIWGGDLNISNSSLILVENTGAINPETEQGITIHANSVDVYSGSKIASSTFIDSLGKSADIQIYTTESLDINNGSVSALSAGVNDSGNISIKTGHDLIINNIGKITTEIQLGGKSKAGNIQILAQGNIKIVEESFIRTSHNGGEGSLGNILLKTQGDIIISGSHNTGIYTATESEAKAGDIIISANGNLNMLDGSQIDSGTVAQGDGGDIKISANNIIIENSIINAESKTKKAGNPGNIVIVGQHQLDLNRAAISIRNHSVKGNSVNQSRPSFLSISAPVIRLTDSQITTQATGDRLAGSIAIAFSDALSLDPSFISTEAQNGNGGDITIRGGGVIILNNSGIETTVHGTKGNGGNITIAADNMVLATGLIQANTVAPNASGGNITLSLRAFLTSGNQLITGGSESIEWRPGVFGLNVIQAAAPNGLNGTIETSAPALNLSGTLANLGINQFDPTALNWESCFSDKASALIRSGKGGIRQNARDSWLY